MSLLDLTGSFLPPPVAKAEDPVSSLLVNLVLLKAVLTHLGIVKVSLRFKKQQAGCRNYAPLESGCKP